MSIKRTEAEIRAELAKIDADERYHYRSATVFENAPLALIQLEMETRATTLAWMLGEKPPKPRRPSHDRYLETPAANHSRGSYRLGGTVSTEIRAKREKLGLSQNAFWGRIGVTQSGGSRYEGGRRIPVTVLILVDLVYGPYAEARKLLTQLRRSN